MKLAVIVVFVLFGLVATFAIYKLRQAAISSYYRQPQPLSVIHGGTTKAEQHVPPPDKQPVPALGTMPPSLPITSSSFATDPELPAFRVRYIAANGTVQDHCLKRVMADSIPDENVLPSSLNPGGDFAHLCDAQQSLEYKEWPF